MTKSSKNKPGVTTRVKLLLIEHGIDKSADELQTMLKDEGYRGIKLSSVTTIAADFRQSCRLLKSAGKLRGVKDVPPANSSSAEAHAA